MANNINDNKKGKGKEARAQAPAMQPSTPAPAASTTPRAAATNEISDANVHIVSKVSPAGIKDLILNAHRPATTDAALAEKQKDADFWKARYGEQRKLVGEMEAWKARAETAEAELVKKQEVVVRLQDNLDGEKEKKGDEKMAIVVAKDVEIQKLKLDAKKEKDKQKTRDEKRKEEYEVKEKKKRELDVGFEKRYLGMHLE